MRESNTGTLADHARDLLDTNRYLTLGTSEADGRPWVTPVYFAWAPEWEFYWASSIDARHSQNLDVRPDVSIVVFDSSVLPYHGRAVYVVGTAQELSGDDLDRGLACYPGPTPRGGSTVTRADMTDPSPYRLYRATTSELWVLCPREPRQPCPRHGLDRDHRARVL